MMPPTSLLDLAGLGAMALTLGVRHGFDADHLAAIDSIARFNALERPALARQAGFWFSLGHGVVVLAVAFAVATVAHGWDVPSWLEPLGAWISIAVLTLFGVINLQAGLRAAPGALVAPIGLRAGWVTRLVAAGRPASVMAVGALFALSFDTLSQATLMVMTGSASRGWALGVALALVFAAGMIVADSANGLLVSRLLRQADASAARASRAMCIGVAVASLATAGLGALARAVPSVGAWASANAGLGGCIVVGTVAGSFLLGLRWSLPARGYLPRGD